jgi:excisionase family DNA binding protein
MTLSELADYLDVPRNTLRRLIEAESPDRFPATKIGRKWRVDVEEVREWLLRMSERGGH